MSPLSPVRWIPRVAGLLAACGLAVCTALAEQGEKKSKWNLVDFIDGLPDRISDRLPGFDPDASIRFYARPHLGDFIHRDYLRTPIGAKLRVDENIESSAEVETYFTHGLKDSAGYGVSMLRLGTKCDHAFQAMNDGAGLSLGFNYQTPLSRPPVDLTDGYRHFQPYVSVTRSLAFLPEWDLLGFATLSADLIEHTENRPNFGENQLHSNSLMLSFGAAREFARFRGSLTFGFNTNSLITDENKHVYSIRPEVVIPWKMRRDAKTQIFVTLGARSVWGPDGNDLGVNSSVRFEFLFRRRHDAK